MALSFLPFSTIRDSSVGVQTPLCAKMDHLQSNTASPAGGWLQRDG